MPQKLLPELMKIVATDDGGYDIISAGHGETMIRFAHLPPDPTTRNHENNYSRALLVSAVTQLRQAVLDLIEHAQPEGYDETTLEGQAWNNAFVALAAADGSLIRLTWQKID